MESNMIVPLTLLWCSYEQIIANVTVYDQPVVQRS